MFIYGCLKFRLEIVFLEELRGGVLFRDVLRILKRFLVFFGDIGICINNGIFL